MYIKITTKVNKPPCQFCGDPLLNNEPDQMCDSCYLSYFFPQYYRGYEPTHCAFCGKPVINEVQLGTAQPVCDLCNKGPLLAGRITLTQPANDSAVV